MGFRTDWCHKHPLVRIQTRFEIFQDIDHRGWVLGSAVVETAANVLFPDDSDVVRYSVHLPPHFESWNAKHDRSLRWSNHLEVFKGSTQTSLFVTQKEDPVLCQNSALLK